jgi:peptidoglycan L-alanyl-D-glutamate endopeptidase CwlK
LIVASRSVDDLAPPVRNACLELCAQAKARGIDLLVYCTLRTLAEQAALYASGRTKPGRILTNAEPGRSLHNPDGLGKAWAFDCVPLVEGKIVWDDHALIDQVGAIGEACGLQWAGRWRGKLRERVHFQIQRG